MFIPLKDQNPSRSFPFVNLLLILANVAVFLYELDLQLTTSPRVYTAFVLAHSTIPARFSSFLTGHTSLHAALFPLLTSMFLHSGILHLAGNMLFLWIFGDNVEDAFGHVPYLIFYLLCGVASALIHIAFNFTSALPALGASGAISGVMGAYLLLYPRSKILTLVFVVLIPLPAVLILVAWFLMQLLSGVGSLGSAAGGGVAWWAHVGGFLVGMLLTVVFRRDRRHLAVA